MFLSGGRKRVVVSEVGAYAISNSFGTGAADENIRFAFAGKIVDTRCDLAGSMYMDVRAVREISAKDGNVFSGGIDAR
jgi:hypothetical protein